MTAGWPARGTNRAIRDALIRLSVCAALGIGLGFTSFHKARAGGGALNSMDDDDSGSGPSYLGDVKDRSGNPIAGAKVTVTVKAYNSSLVLRADDQGHFTVKGFDKNISPDEVEFACSADGYKFFAGSRQPTGSDPKSPIEVDCVLEKQ